MHKILPIWRPEDHAKFPSSIENLIGPEIPTSCLSQKPLKLIDGQHSRRRIIDRFGERLDRDIDQNAKRKERILLHCTLGAKDNGHLQLALVDDTRTAIQHEERFAQAHKITDLWGKLNHTFRIFRLGDERLHVHRDDNRRFPAMKEDGKKTDVLDSERAVGPFEKK